MNKNLIIITSIINTHHSDLSYAKRSVFTPHERFLQTLETIVSIKKYFENYYIVLIEASELLEEYENLFKSNVDYYYNINNSKFKKYIDGPYKALGEISFYIEYFSSNHFLENKKNFNSISKISGRYSIISDYKIDNNLSKIYAHCNYFHKNMTTILFTIPINELDDFIKISYNGYNDIELSTGLVGLEQYLYRRWLINKKYLDININVEGYISVNGEHYKSI